MSHIVKSQKKFFDANAVKTAPQFEDPPIIKDYVNREQIDGLDWVKDCKKIIDYGAGTGETIYLLNTRFPDPNRTIHAVDISKISLEVAKKKNPRISIETIQKNKIVKPSNSTDAVTMVHVLHHAHNHDQIIKEIHRVLKPGGKLMINDLSSANPIIKFLRKFYPFIPKKIKNHFSDDLSTPEGIPDKYKINLATIKFLLEKTGFKIIKVGYGHLFFFLFCWIERLIPVSKIPLVEIAYKSLINLEKWLINHAHMSKFAEVIYIYAVKK